MKKEQLSNGEFLYLFGLYTALLVGVYYRDAWMVAVMSILLVIKQLGRIRTAIERSQS